MSLIESKAYDIRYSEQGDHQRLIKWLSWPGMAKNFSFNEKRELELFVRNWSYFFRYRSSLTATYKKNPVGIATLFLMPYQKVSKHGMLSFIVDPTILRKGIGSSLIRNINHLGKTKFQLERIYLDVFDGSDAKTFLETCGYKEVFYQEKFIKEANGTYRGRHLMEVMLK